MGSTQTKQKVSEKEVIPPPPTFNPDDCGHDFLISADDLMDIKKQDIKEETTTEHLFQKQFTDIPNLTYNPNELTNKAVISFLDKLKKQMEIFVKNENCPFRFYAKIVYVQGYKSDKNDFLVLEKYFKSKGYVLYVQYNDQYSYNSKNEHIYTFIFMVTSKQYTDKYCLERREAIQEQMIDSLHKYILELFSEIDEDDKWIKIHIPRSLNKMNEILKLGIITFDKGYIGTDNDFYIDYKYAIDKVLHKLMEDGYWVGMKKMRRLVVFKGKPERDYFKRMMDDDGYTIREPSVVISV